MRRDHDDGQHECRFLTERLTGDESVLFVAQDDDAQEGATAAGAHSGFTGFAHMCVCRAALAVVVPSLSAAGTRQRLAKYRKIKEQIN